MRLRTALNHLQLVLHSAEAAEERLQKRYGPAMPRSARAFDKRTIEALRLILNKPAPKDAP